MIISRIVASASRFSSGRKIHTRTFTKVRPFACIIDTTRSSGRPIIRPIVARPDITAGASRLDRGKGLRFAAIDARRRVGSPESGRICSTGGVMSGGSRAIRNAASRAVVAPSAPPAPSSASLSMRDERMDVRTFDLPNVDARTMQDSRPWRTFRWWRGQRHYSGLYWSATMHSHVAYESRMELARLLFADRDRSVRAIYAQPFLLTATVSGRIRRHVPDFLLVGADGGLQVVDVKPRARLAKPQVADVLAWAGEVIRASGWGFEVWSDPDPLLLANVRFLAGYRRADLFDSVVLEAVRSVTAEPVSIQAVESTLSLRWPAAVVRPHVLHLLWSGHLNTDLGGRLGGTSLVRWTP